MLCRQTRFPCLCVCVCVCDPYFERWILVQRWAGRPIWLRSAEASVERWTPPFCGIRTSVVGWLSIQCVCSPMPRQKKRASDVLGYGLLQSLWDRYWGGLRRRCFRPPALGGCVCMCRPIIQTKHSVRYHTPRLQLCSHCGLRRHWRRMVANGVVGGGSQRLAAVEKTFFKPFSRAVHRPIRKTETE